MTTAYHLIEAASVYSVANDGATGAAGSGVNVTSLIHATIARMPAGGTLWIPPGDYYVKQLNFSKAMKVTGGGTLRNYDNSDNTTGDNEICRITSDDVTLDGIKIIGAVSTTATAPATYYGLQIFSDGSDDPYERIRIVNCYFEGGRQCLRVTEGKDLWVANNVFKAGWDYNISGPNACDRVTIIGNTFLDSYNNAGIRTGALTDAEPTRDLLIAFNKFYNCGLATGQDAIDISTAGAERVSVIGNQIRDCGDGLELKCASTAGSVDDILIADNIFTSSLGATYNAAIRINTSTSGAQDHIQRVVVQNNLISYADGAGSIGIGLSSHTDVTLRGNTIFGALYPFRLSSNNAGIEMTRPVIEGNRSVGGYGVYITASAAEEILDLVIANNDFQFIHTGIANIESGGNGCTLTRPRIIGNRLRCIDSSSDGIGMNLCGLQAAMIAQNDILALGEGIRIANGLTNTTVCITKNTIDCSDATHGLEGVDVNASTGTIQIFDNTILTDTDQRGWTDAGAGATVLPGTNKRGVRSAIPTDAGALNDTFDDSVPAAGATKWVCTTAGGSGAATWTAQ